MTKQFTKTWRHEVVIEAETAEDARLIWEDLSLGNLDQKVADGVVVFHGFVEDVSFTDEENCDVE